MNRLVGTGLKIDVKYLKTFPEAFEPETLVWRDSK